MSANDKFNELEIETVSAVIAAEQGNDCESCKHFDKGEICESDFHQHYHSSGCLALIAGLLGIISLITAKLWIG